MFYVYFNPSLLLYQLPTGNTISLSIEQYLDLTDEDIQYLISLNAGFPNGNPFYASTIKERVKHIEPEDRSIDYVDDSETVVERSIIIISDEEIITEIPDISEDLIESE